MAIVIIAHVTLCPRNETRPKSRNQQSVLEVSPYLQDSTHVQTDKNIGHDPQHYFTLRYQYFATTSNHPLSLLSVLEIHLTLHRGTPNQY
jgi:hypothetical protein